MSDVVQRLEDMAVGRSQHATDRNDARSAADDVRAVIARLEAQAEPIVAPAECDSSCDDPECPYSHKPLTLRQAYENAVTRLRSAEAALRAAVPEEGPVGVRCTGCGSSWDDDRLAEEKAKRPELLSCCPERKIVPVYLRPTPRPDMERELAEVIEQRDYFKAEAEAGTEYIAAQREKIDLLGRELAEARKEVERLKYERDVWRSKSNMHQKSAVSRTIAEAERDALAADNARLVEALGKLEKAATVVSRHGAQTGSWWSDLTTGLIYARAAISRAALSGASIPATADKPHKAPSERELLHKIEGVLRTPSSGHASANELAETILDAICPGYLGALEWAVERWRDEVQHRPIQNIHRRSLDDAWRQVIRHFGGEDILLCGPAHDDLAALSGASIPAPAKAGRKMEPVSIDYLRGQIGEILVLELDAKEDGRAVSQAVERILALVAASSAPDKAEAIREEADPIEKHLAERNRRDTIARAIPNPARREGE